MPRQCGRSQSVGETCTIRINGREPGLAEEIASSTARGTWMVRILSARSSPALPLAEPLAGGNLLADLVASIGRNDQTHHHPTVHGRGKFAARPSLYGGEDDVSEGAALHDRGDVVDEDGVGVVVILDRQSFDVAVFHRSPPSTDLRPAWSPLSSLCAATSAGLSPSLPAGSATVPAAEFRAGPTETPWSVTLHSERSQEVENGLLGPHRQLPEFLHHRIRLGRREIFGRRREMLDDGLEQVAGPPVVEEEQPLADAPERNGAEFVRPGLALDGDVGKSGAP